jgi:AcrR family transcriptional regulator
MQNGTSEKKTRILKAAYDCFLQYGYKKTTFVDIAKRAGISRASMYLYFRNKEDLYITMNKDLQDKYVAMSGEILKSGCSGKEKLLKIIDVWITDAYQQMKNTNYANELLDGLVHISRQTEQRFRDLFMESIEPLVGKDVAEVIVFSMRGLLDDRPAVPLLQKRIRVLVQSTTKPNRPETSLSPHFTGS